MKFNLFKTVSNDFKNMLDYMGIDILINNKPARAIITINSNDDRTISTDFEIKRGDLIFYADKYWYVMDNPTTKKYESFKGTLRQAEHLIRFNLSEYTGTGGGYTSYHVVEAPAIVETTSALQLQSGNYMSLQTGKINITIQDNDLARQIANSLGSKKEHNVLIGNKSYSYEGFDFVDVGFMHINIDVISSSASNDFTQMIAWTGSHAGWNGDIDTSFYTDDIPPEQPEEPKPDPELPTTNVGEITYTVGKAYSSSSADGEITINYQTDPQATKYKVTLLNTSNEVKEEIETTELTYTFDYLVVGSYNVEVSSYDGTQYCTPQRVNNIVVEYDSGGGWGGGW